MSHPSALNIETIRDYLLSVGCKVEYPILVNAFKQHLYNPDPNVQGRIRTQFKDYVNRLATVGVENNMKFIILRPEFRPAVDEKPPASRTQQQQLSATARLPTSELHDTSAKQRRDPGQPQVLPNQQLTKPPQSFPQPLSVQQQLQQQHQPVQHEPFSRNPMDVSPPQTAPPPPVPQHHRPHNQRQNKQRLHFASSSDSSATQFNHTQIVSPTPIQPVSRSAVSQQPTQPLQQLQQLAQYQVQRQRQSSHAQSGHRDVFDGGSVSMPPPPVPGTQMAHSASKRNQLTRPESLNLSAQQQQAGANSSQMPPPRPPPRRRQSTASLFKPLHKSNTIESIKQEVAASNENLDSLRKISLGGRVREHAFRFNSTASSTSDLSVPMPKRNPSMKENRLSRDSALGSLSSALQRNGSQLTTRSRSSHREDESDSSSLQPIDPLRRKWAIEACQCNYNGLLTLLRDEPKLATYRDIVNGYTALHWAAKFGNTDIIKLIAGTYCVSANTKSSAGHTPLHVAYMFNRTEAANLLLKSYSANPNIRDHSGKRPMQHWAQQKQTT